MFLKTFKLISFQLVDKNDEMIQIPFIDALIINKENEKNTWLIELFIERAYFSVFENYQPQDKFPVNVIITKAENDPATFLVNVINSKVVDEYVSILLEGTLSRSRGYAEQLLGLLLDKGLSGNELLLAFKEEIRTKKNKVGRSSKK